MFFEICVAVAIVANAVGLWLLSQTVLRLIKRLDTAETALSGVKPICDEMARTQNEIRDIRETLESLPLDDLQAAADYDRALMDGLENIANYSLGEAMKKAGDCS